MAKIVKIGIKLQHEIQEKSFYGGSLSLENKPGVPNHWHIYDNDDVIFIAPVSQVEHIEVYRE